MDKKDLKILSILQKNGATPIAELAEAVGLSSTPCWRRVQKMQEEGVIRDHVVLCDAAKLNVAVTVFVSVRTNQHSDSWVKKFVQGTRDIPEIVEIYRMSGDIDYLLKIDIPEIVEIYRMSGDIDYLLKIVVPDIAGYDAVYKRLIKAVDLHDVSSSFAMEVLKSTTALPLDYVQ